MAKKETSKPTVPVLPMLKTVEQMSRISGIGENKLRELMDSGELEYIQNGNRPFACRRCYLGLVREGKAKGSSPKPGGR